jgi:hypothetical protein
MRGPVKIVELTDGRILWPKCRSGKRARAIILYGDLARAVRRESAAAVAYWFGAGMFTVWKWRKALGVDRVNEGTSALFSRNAPDTVQSDKAIDNLVDALKSPERAAKIAASKRGKARPAHVHEALKAANVGRMPSDEARANMSAAQKRRGVRPPAAKGMAWMADEDALLGAMPDTDVAERIGRTLSAVQSRRYLLSVGAFTVSRY